MFKRSLIFVLFFVGLLFAGTNCEVKCCKDYAGKWDDRWDRCWKPQEGYDECVSNCTAETIHKYSSHIDKSDIEPIECKIGASMIMVTLLILLINISEVNNQYVK